jgi:hypothetical protein
MRAKTKVMEILIREILFADDAVLTSHTKTCLQELVNRLSHVCKEFGLSFSLQKTNILAQGTDTALDIINGNTHLEVVETFTYLGSMVSSTISLDAEISSRIKTATADTPKHK